MAYVIATFKGFSHENLLVVFHTGADSVSLQAEDSEKNIVHFRESNTVKENVLSPILIDGVGLQSEQNPLHSLYLEGSGKKKKSLAAILA